MKEKPILFSGEMVRAILDGRKTQTRRVIKPQPEPIPEDVWKEPDEKLWWSCKQTKTMIQLSQMKHFNPYGDPGDQLWVRETFSLTTALHDPIVIVKYEADNEASFYNLMKNHEVGQSKLKLDKKHPSIHMPRWASRIQIEVLDMRVERVQDITLKDAQAEGCMGDREFMDLWDTINQKRGFGWDENPWVWVVEFKRIEK